MCMKKEKKGKRETERCREEEGKRHREVSDKKRDKITYFYIIYIENIETMPGARNL